MVQGAAGVSVRTTILASGQFEIARKTRSSCWRSAGTITESGPAALFMGKLQPAAVSPLPKERTKLALFRRRRWKGPLTLGCNDFRIDKRHR